MSTALAKSGGAFARGDLLSQLAAARERLDRATELMQRSLELRALLHMGVLDLDDAKTEVWEYRRACQAHRRYTP